MPVTAEITVPFPSIGLESPPERIWAVTPSDTDQLPRVARAIRVGTGGDLAVVDLRGTTTVVPDVLDGETIIGLIKQVKATGTTASGITAFA